MRPRSPDTPAHIRLADGRRFAWTVNGPAEGRPVVYCHGALGTPVAASVDLDGLCARIGVRFLAPWRPGIGGSDPCPGRTVRSWVADLSVWLDHLGLARVDLIGVSAGGPYALAAAAALPGRVGRVALVSSLSPVSAPHRTPGLDVGARIGLGLLATRPEAVQRWGDRLLYALAAHPGAVAALTGGRPSRRRAGPDGTAGAGELPARIAATIAFIRTGAAGAGGLVDDYRVYARPRELDLSEVHAEVDLWHGLGDRLVPADHALTLAAALPRCRVHLDADAGHHFFRARLGAILAALTGPASQPGRPDGGQAAARRCESNGGRSTVASLEAPA